MPIAEPDQWDNAASWADAYRNELALAVIPAGRDKHPIDKWKEFQDNGIPQAVHNRWYGADGSNTNDFGMGFICGAASLGDGWKLLVVDCDVKGKVSGLQTIDRWLEENELGRPFETWTTASPSGGRHYFFRFPATLTVKTAQYGGIGIDVRACGGFIVSPPSRSYRWILSPFDTELAQAPQWLLDILDTEVAGQPNAGRQRPDGDTADTETDAFG